MEQEKLIHKKSQVKFTINNDICVKVKEELYINNNAAHFFDFSFQDYFY